MMNGDDLSDIALELRTGRTCPCKPRIWNVNFQGANSEAMLGDSKAAAIRAADQPPGSAVAVLVGFLWPVIRKGQSSKKFWSRI